MHVASGSCNAKLCADQGIFALLHIGMQAMRRLWAAKGQTHPTPRRGHVPHLGEVTWRAAPSHVHASSSSSMDGHVHQPYGACVYRGDCSSWPWPGQRASRPRRTPRKAGARDGRPPGYTGFIYVDTVCIIKCISYEQ